MKSKLGSTLRQCLVYVLVFAAAGWLTSRPALGATPNPTATALAAVPTSGSVGTVFTLTATVSVKGKPVTAGSVSFKDGNRLLGTAQVITAGPSKGSAILKTTSFAPGSNVISASYSGAPNAAQPTAPSTATATITVTGLQSTALSLSTNVTPGHPGNYDLTAALSGFGPASLSGTVNFSEATGNILLGTVPLGASIFGLGPIHSYTGASPNATAVVADFDDDGFLDVAVGTALFLGDPSHPGQFLLSNNPLPGVAIAVGDFNSDGLPDLIVVVGDPSFGTLGIALGDPAHPGEFLPEAQIVTASGPTVVGDFNGDGVLDIVATAPFNLDFPLNSIYVILGDPANPGQFLPPAAYQPFPGFDPRQSSITDMAAGDFNGDGLPDLAVTIDEVPGHQYLSAVYIMLGDPAQPGRLLTGTPYGTGPQPSSVATGDFNGDGILDLVTTNAGVYELIPIPASVSVLLGDPDHPGQFLPQTQYSVPQNPGSVTVADFNHDGAPDLAIAFPWAANVGILLGDTAKPGQFLPPQYVTIGIPAATDHPVGPFSVVTADLNGDLLPDLITADGGAAPALGIFLDVQTATAQLLNVSPGSPGQYNLTAAYSGNAGFAASSIPQPVPVVVPHPTITTLTATPATGPLGTVFTLTATVAVGGKPVTSGSVQFNDGKRPLGSAQVISSGPSTGTVVLKISSFGSGSQSLTAAYSGAPQSAQSTAPSTSTPAVITVTGISPTSTNLSILSSTLLPGTYDITATLQAAGSDIGHGTLSINERSSGTSLASQSVSTAGGFLPPAIMSSGTDASSYFINVALADLNGDGVLDVILLSTHLFGNTPPNNLIIQFGDPSHPGQFLPPVTYVLSAAADWIAVGDVNGDGLPDVIVGPNGNGDGTGLIGRLLNNPAHPGQLTSELIVGSVGAFSGAQGFLADLNADGVLDLALTTGTDVSVLFGDPRNPGLFGPPQKLGLSLSSGASLSAVADLNQDGLNDLVVFTPPTSTISVFLADPVHPGQFAAGTVYPAGYGAEVGDFNGDGLPDIFSQYMLLLNDPGHPGNFLNVPTNLPVAASYYFVTASYYLVADMNGDGVADVIGLAPQSTPCDPQKCWTAPAFATVLLTNPAAPGQFALPGATYNLGFFYFGAPAVGDLNGDGQLDVVAASLNSVTQNSAGFLEMLGNQAATLTLQNTTVPGTGISSVGAAYSGDAHYLPSGTGATVIETSASATTTQLTASTNNIAAGSQLTLNALVQASTLVPPSLVNSGSVTFYDGAAVLCTVTVNAFGQANCSATLPSLGAHSIYAAYTPAITYASSTSSYLTVLVTGGATLTASPNPIPVASGSLYGTTTILWNGASAQTVEVHVGSPTGTLFAGGGSTGSATTGAWVTDGLVFYLQDTTGGKPLTAANTLAILVVQLQQQSAIAASPNPVPVPPGSVLGTTTIQWNAPAAQSVEVHVNSPTGPLFAGGSNTGSAITGDWVTDGMTFYLQDVTGGKALDQINTIATVVVHLEQQSAVFTADPNPIPTPLIGATTLHWNAPTASTVEVHVGSPTGTLFTRGGPAGSAVTGDWVTEGLVFYLQDVSGGKPLTPANTLAQLVLHVGQTNYFSASPNPISDWVVVNGTEVGSTTLQWNAPEPSSVEIRIDSPAGPLLTMAGPVGSIQTGLVATDGRAFYLQDATNGDPTSPSNTLAMLITHLTKQATPFLTASPNPINSNGTGVATTTLSWSAPTSGTVQIRVGSPSGPLFYQGGSTGTATTGNWVTNGELFYLQDTTGGKPLTAANTLAVLIVQLSN